MKNIIFTCLILILFSSCFINKKSTKCDKESFTVISYNVENLFDYEDDILNTGDDEFLPTASKQWTKERYEKKINDLAKVLYSIDSIDLPEIAAVFEVENRRVLEDLINTDYLKSGNYGIAHEDSPDGRGIDVALIYKKEKFNYILHKTLKIELENDTTFATRDILYVKGNNGNDTFHIFVNHWPSRRGGQAESEHKRVYAASVLRNFIDEIFKNEPNANIIIMGDMNDEPQNKSLSETLNAKNNNPLTSSSELYNLMYDKDLNKEGTFSYNGEWNMLDNMIISKNLLTKEDGFKADYTSGTIFKADFLLYYNTKIDQKTPSKTFGGDNYFGGYSDHLPIYMTLHK